MNVTTVTETQTLARAEDTSQQTGRILAVLGGLGTLAHVEHTVELACHLCEKRNAQLVLTYPLIVPLSMPLDASLPDQEAQASDAIKRGLRVSWQHGFDVRASIVRHRRAADAVLELAQAEQVQAIVLGVRINTNLQRDYDKAETAEYEIFRRAECEVIVDREPTRG